MSKLYVGVDWHKRTSTWVAINEQREKVYERVWDCTPEAVAAAVASLPATPSRHKAGRGASVWLALDDWYLY